MRKASMVLGIIGGSISILYTLFLIFTTLLIGSLGPTPGAFRLHLTAGGVILLIVGLLLLAGGGLGLAGGIIVPKRNVLAGVFMLVSSVFGVMTCVSFILLLLGGIFALVKEQPPAPPLSNT